MSIHNSHRCTTKSSLIDANINSAIMAMLDIVQPKNDDVDEDATNADVLPDEKYARNQPIIPVSRESNEPTSQQPIILL